METLHTILTIVQVIMAVVLVVFVTMQSSKGDGMSALAGSSDGFMSKNKASTKDALLAKLTKWIGGLFLLLTLALTLIQQSLI